MNVNQLLVSANRFLIKVLESLNIVMAGLIVLAFSIAGSSFVEYGGDVGFLIGLAITLCGFIVAAILCGLLATLFDIRRQLVMLNTRAGSKSERLG